MTTRASPILRSTLALCAPLAIATSAMRYDWSTANLGWLSNPKYSAEAEPSRGVCARLIHVEPPAADRPTPAQVASLNGCNAEALLYGIGRPADPVAARKCAILQRDRDPDTNIAYFRGPGILTVAYANGLGGARNLDIATHMACGVEDAPAATQARIADLQARRTSTGDKPFSICDAATSGASGAICSEHDAHITDRTRSDTVAGLERDWPSARRIAFRRAYTSLQAYAHIAHELDCFGGTLSAACTIDGVEQDKTRFLAKIGVLLGRNPPPLVPEVNDRINAATTPKLWRDTVSSVDPDDRASYEDNGRKTIAARARFERDLLAFAATVPDATTHAVRALFSDL